ncbi:RcpC/CpaB family pilus assembly protein [Streptomyces sp. NPDC005131]
MAAGLALTAAALAATGLTGGDGGSGAADRARGSAPEGERRPVRLVSAPVRIADAATVRLLPGDRVDVIAGEGSGADARVVAKGARVAAVPRTAADGAAEYPAEGGALVVLSVPRRTAASLAGAGISARLAVTLC